MKKIIFFVMIFILLMCSCGIKESRSKNDSGSEETEKSDNITEKLSDADKESHEGELVLIHGDRQLYEDFDSLMEASDIVVIGEFVEDTKQEIKMIYDSRFGKHIINDIDSTNFLRIEKVFKGEVKIGEEIMLIQRYGIDPDNGNMISFSDLTPMTKGEKWIYFLTRSEKDGEIYYYASGDYCGRYPLSIEGEVDAEKFGVYEKGCINIDLYKEIMEKLEI